MSQLDTLVNNVTPNKSQTSKWVNNLIVFLIPVGILYFGQIASVLQSEGNVIDLSDFLPNSYNLGAMSLYVVNVLIDYGKKVKAS